MARTPAVSARVTSNKSYSCVPLAGRTGLLPQVSWGKRWRAPARLLVREKVLQVHPAILFAVGRARYCAF